MFVTIATVAGSLLNDPSLSSASTTIHSPSPNLALEPYAFMTPPLMTVGSKFPTSAIEATSEVVVVFP